MYKLKNKPANDVHEQQKEYNGIISYFSSAKIVCEHVILLS